MNTMKKKQIKVKYQVSFRIFITQFKSWVRMGTSLKVLQGVYKTKNLLQLKRAEQPKISRG